MISAVKLHVTLNVKRLQKQNKAGTLGFSTGMMLKLATSNLPQAMMLQRSKIHSI